jgi:hypothetical protein
MEMKHELNTSMRRAQVERGLLLILATTVIAVVVAMVFASCTSLPNSGGGQETIAKAEVSVGAAYKALNDLYLLNKVSKPDALKYRSQLVKAEDLLKQAEVAVRSNDASTSTTAANAATAIINQVTQALAARKAAP